MLHAFYYPRDLITERVRFTPADHAQITHCRGVHNRLGFAYQMGFVRLTGRFPAQQPLEMLHDLLVWVAREVGIDPSAIEAYAQRRQTVSEHQLLLQGSLGLRPCGPAERDLLGRFLREEALRLESTPALIAQAEAFLRAAPDLKRFDGFLGFELWRDVQTLHAVRPTSASRRSSQRDG